MESALAYPVTSIPAEGVRVDATLEPDALSQDPDQASEVAAANIAGTLSGGDGLYTFRGEIKGAYVGTCDRCAEEVELGYALPVHWTFLVQDEAFDDAQEESEGGASGDELATVLTYDGEKIDLAPPMWEEIVLARPVKFPPMEVETSACTLCGKTAEDWVSGDDSEEEVKKENTGFAGLRDMFPNLPDGPAEE